MRTRTAADILHPSGPVTHRRHHIFGFGTQLEKRFYCKSRFNVVTILQESALSRRSSGLETAKMFFSMIAFSVCLWVGAEDRART